VEQASKIKQMAIDTDKLLRLKMKDEIKLEAPMDQDPMSCMIFADAHDVSVLEEVLPLEVEDENEEFDNHEQTESSFVKPSRRESQRRNLPESTKSFQEIWDLVPKRNQTPDADDYKCFLCNLKFSQVSTKNKHVKIDHAEERVCKICNAKSKTALSLEVHVKFHFRDANFLCEICCKTFRYRNRLNFHMKLHHKQSISVSCDLCGLTTKFKNNIKRHMESVHLKLKHFSCTFCVEKPAYSTQEALNSHLYRCHDVQAPIQCSDCSMGFTFESELRAHKRHNFCSKSPYAVQRRVNKSKPDHLEVLDTGEFKCVKCNVTFFSKNKWSMHNYLKHKYSNRCDECNVSFTNYTSLIRHVKVKHEGIKNFKW